MSFSVIIPTANENNLRVCVEALTTYEPALQPDKIIVVDDGPEGARRLRLPVMRVKGQKPFIFARNINQGIRVARHDDVVLLNDDACLMTRNGLSILASHLRLRPRIGVCSVGIVGTVCNRRQLAQPGGRFRHEPHLLAFVCAYIPRKVISKVGMLDERFDGYGFEDFDYCHRVKEAGFDLAIWDGCQVEHERLPSTFRSRPDIGSLFSKARAIYEDKWASVVGGIH